METSARTVCVEVAKVGVLASRAHASAAIAEEHARSAASVEQAARQAAAKGDTARAIECLAKAVSLAAVIRHIRSEIEDALNTVSCVPQRAPIEYADGFERVTSPSLAVLVNALARSRAGEAEATLHASNVQRLVNAAL